MKKTSEVRGASAPRPFTVAEEVAELQKLDVPAMVARYRALWGAEPRVRSREALFEKCAWKLQEARKDAAEKPKGLVASFALPRPGKPKYARPGQLRVGSAITRVWHGQTVTLRVVDAGFELDGVIYRSLSAAAKALTGAHWNGRLFWGLAPRRKP